ncbi:MAG: Gfo/Idh/MocA family oxidoreductase [Spirochaetes bacterium]|nr:Gfo/Idh/MocA family oxidoreductase [Spirochaetota bacterium]
MATKKRKFKTAADIKVGVIGYGGAFNMGRGHLNEMKKAGMTPVAVAEIDETRLAEARKDFPGIETYNSVAKMLSTSNVDIITIITPHNTHAKLALQCLKAGKSVVCEKPFAITTAECDAMIAEAKKKNLLLTTYHNRHWDGCVMQGLKTIKSGAIGDIVRIEAHMGKWGKPRDWWRSSKTISGGIMYDWGVHILEYSLQILNDDIKEVTGFAKYGFWGPKITWKKDANEDEGYAVVRFAKGEWLTIALTAIDSNPKRGMIEITGTKGSYIMDHNTWEVIKSNDDGSVTISKGNNPPSEWWRYYQNVADHLVKGTKLVITAEWARRPIHILDLADKSAKAGKALAAKYK